MKLVFNIEYFTEFGQNLHISGNIPELGSWDEGQAPPMHYVGNGKWEFEIFVESDSLQSLDLSFWYMFDIDGGLKLGLDLNDSINNSNQDYYEIVGPGPLDYELTHGFYDYNSYRITPNASYTFALFPLTTGLSYAYEKTDYSNRRAKFSDGLYKDNKHWEIQQEINLDFRYDLLENWSVFAQWQWIDTRSNNDDERVYRYDYTANSYSVGVSYKY